MAKLTTKARKKIPESEFGEPNSRKFPMPDRAHAANAKARASEMVNKGKVSKSTQSKINVMADKILRKDKKK